MYCKLVQQFWRLIKILFLQQAQARNLDTVEQATKTFSHQTEPALNPTHCHINISGNSQVIKIIFLFKVIT